MNYFTTEGAQGICPSGWHIPTLSEFEDLRDAVYGDGNALKAIDQGEEAGAGTNTSGFSALLAGHRGYYCCFGNLGLTNDIWSSTVEYSFYRYHMSLNNRSKWIHLGPIKKSMGFSRSRYQ